MKFYLAVTVKNHNVNMHSFIFLIIVARVHTGFGLKNMKCLKYPHHFHLQKRFYLHLLNRNFSSAKIIQVIFFLFSLPLCVPPCFFPSLVYYSVARSVLKLPTSPVLGFSDIYWEPEPLLLLLYNFQLYTCHSSCYNELYSHVFIARETGSQSCLHVAVFWGVFRN